MCAHLRELGFVNAFVAPDPSLSPVSRFVQTLTFVQTGIIVPGVCSVDLGGRAYVGDVRIPRIHSDSSDKGVCQALIALRPAPAGVFTTVDAVVGSLVIDIRIAGREHHVV